MSGINKKNMISAWNVGYIHRQEYNPFHKKLVLYAVKNNKYAVTFLLFKKCNSFAIS